MTIVINDLIHEVEAVNDRKEELGEELKIILDKAKANGVNTKALKEVIRLRKMKQTELTQYQELLDEYMKQLGMI